jgi:MYXO-CTERM domain-containing protein
MEPFTGAKPFLDLTAAALADVGWAISGACGDGARDEGEQCDSGADNGTARSSCAVTCIDSGKPTCGNGVIAGNEQCDEGAANGTPFSCCSASCTLKKAGSTCRPLAGDCDIEETCSGTSVVCPPDTWRAAGTICRPVAGVCDVAEQCPGDGPGCPEDLVLVGGPPCRASMGRCDPPEFCDASSAGCPPDVLVPTGTACDDGNVCTMGDTCQAGVCQPGAPFVCPSAGECFQPAACDPVARICRAFTKPEGTACSTGACMQGVCTAIVIPPPPEPTPEPTVEPAMEPAPEPAPEPAAEPAPEPAPEPAVEPLTDGGAETATAADAGLPEAGTGSDTGAVVTDARTADESGGDATASPAVDGSAAAASDGAGRLPISTAASDSAGCGCALGQAQNASFAGSAGMLALLWAARRRRRHRENKH